MIRLAVPEHEGNFGGNHRLQIEGRRTGVVSFNSRIPLFRSSYETMQL